MARNERRLPVTIRSGRDYDFKEADFHVRVALNGADTFPWEDNKARAALGEVNPRYARLDDVEREKLKAIGEIFADIEAQLVRPVIAPHKGEEGSVEGALIQALMILRSYSQRGFDRWLARENRFLANREEDWGNLYLAWQELLNDGELAYYNLRWIKPDGSGWESFEDSWHRLGTALADYLLKMDVSTEAAEKAGEAKMHLLAFRVEAAGIDIEAFSEFAGAEKKRLSAPEEEPAAETSSEA